MWALEPKPWSDQLPKCAPVKEPPKPAPVTTIRPAWAQDAFAIAKIMAEYDLPQVELSSHPQNGWLLQVSGENKVWYSMACNDYFVTESGPEDGPKEVVAFQKVTAPRFISRPPDKHKLFDEYREVVTEMFRSGKFVYASTIAKKRGEGDGDLVAALQDEAFSHYRDELPIVSHVAVFVEGDLEGWNGDPATLDPKHNNIASHRYHQKHGFIPVAYTCDIPDPRFNTGFKETADGATRVCGVLYVRFPDGEIPPLSEYVDPIKLVLGAPVQPGEFDFDKPWENPLPSGYRKYVEPAQVNRPSDLGFIPSPAAYLPRVREAHRGAMLAIRKPV